MSNFYKDVLHREQIQNSDDQGVNTSEVHGLLTDTEYKETLDRVFENEIKEDHFISIPGSSLVVNLIKNRDYTFKKFDILSNLGNIECQEIQGSKSLRFKFTNIEDNIVEEYTDGKDELIAETIHSAKADFLEGSFKMKKFSDFLISEGLKDIALENINRLSQIYSDDQSKDKRYRLLKDKDSNYFLRGMTSVDRYHDYNIRFSIFLTLLSIHRVIMKTKASYGVSYAFLDDSNIQVTFEKSGQRKLGDIGHVKFYVTLLNDEIRRESLKIVGMSSIVYGPENNRREVFTQTKQLVKSGILSISHGSKPENWLAQIEILSSKISNVQNQLFEDFENLKAVKDADQLRFKLENSFKFASSDQIKPYKDRISSVLSERVDSIHALLDVMNKIDLMAKEDLEAKEFIRYVFYQQLTRKKGS